MSYPVLDVRNLEVKFNHPGQETIAVDKINFQLKAGKTLGIVGESGSGKSVTALAIMGLLPQPGKVTQGEIWFQPRPEKKAVNLLSLPEKEKRLFRGGAIAMIFQEPMSSLNPVQNIGFQISEGILLHQKVTEAEARRQAVARLQEVKLLPTDEQLQQQYLDNFISKNPGAVPSDSLINKYINQQKLAMLKRYPHQLSGGQLQRVMIAMALACNPSVLIADEPTTALDVTVQATILQLLRELSRARGMSLIFISHDLGVIASMADQVAVMYQGKIVELGQIQQILNYPQHPYTQGLLACRPSLEEKWSYLPTVADFLKVDQLVVLDKPLVTPTIIPPEQQQQRLQQLMQKEPLIRVENLCVGFPQRGIWGNNQGYLMAVNHVNFEVYPGETLGLVGESGCGKSTLARALLRLIPVLQGEIRYRGENLAQMSLGDKRLRPLRRQLQIIFQNPYSSLNPRLTIGDAILEPLLIHQVGGNRAKQKERVAYLLERVGLNPAWQKRYPHEFSGGQRQRVCIARALALNPEFIICDESVSALDVSVQAQVLNLLKELQAEFGLTYIFISHDLSVVKFLSDRIMVMNRGKIAEIGAAEQIYRSPTQEYTRKLIAAIPGSSLSPRLHKTSRD